jgi:hypothetical protein
LSGSPKRTAAAVAAKVVAARKQAPCFGARRLVETSTTRRLRGKALRVEAANPHPTQPLKIQFPQPSSSTET